jgi:hypothetical protein
MQKITKLKTSAKYFMASAGLLVLLCSNGFSQQLSPALYKKYSPDVISKVYDIHEQMQYSLTDSSQSWLADAFAKQEDVVASFMQKNNDAKAIRAYRDSIYWTIVEIDFPKIIAQKEKTFFERMEDNWDVPSPVLNGVIAPDMEMNSLFGLALWNNSKNKFILDPGQIIKFTKLAKDVKRRMNGAATDPNVSPFDKDYFETVNAIICLGSKHYGELIALKNRKSIQIQTFNEWNNLKEAGYAEKFNKDQTIREITMYHQSQIVEQALLDWMMLSKENLYVSDSVFHNLTYYTQRVYDSIADTKKRVDKKKPEALAILTEIKNRSPQRVIQKAKVLIGANRDGYLGTALFMCDALHLTDAQVDSLTLAAIRLQDGGFAGDQMIVFESEQLNRILTEDKYRSVCHFKMNSQNIVRAQKVWDELVQRKLTDAGMDEKQVKLTITFFFSEGSFIRSRYALEPEEMSRKFSELEKRRPYELSLLAEARRASKGNNNSGYAW